MRLRWVATACIVALSMAGCSSTSTKNPSTSASSSASSGSGKVVFPDRSKAQAATVSSSVQESGSKLMRAEVGKQIQPGRYEIRLSGNLDTYMYYKLFSSKRKVTARTYMYNIVDLRQIQSKQGYLLTVDLTDGDVLIVSQSDGGDFAASFTPVATHLQPSPTGAGSWVVGLDIPSGKFRLTGILDNLNVYVFTSDERIKFRKAIAPIGQDGPSVIELERGDTLFFTASSFPGAAAGGGGLTLTPSTEALPVREWKDTAPSKATGQPILVEPRLEAYKVGPEIPSGYYRIESAVDEPLTEASLYSSSESLFRFGSMFSFSSGNVSQLDPKNIAVVHLVRGQEYYFTAKPKSTGKWYDSNWKSPVFRLVPIDKPKVNVNTQHSGVYMVGRDIPPGVYEYGGKGSHLWNLDVASPQVQTLNYWRRYRANPEETHEVRLVEGQAVFISADGPVKLRKKK